MELRARAEKLAAPRRPTALPPVTKDTALISGLEHDTQMNRFLRGVMCFLALLCFILSIFQIESYPVTVLIHVIILLLSVAGEVCIVFIYAIKARFSGFTNPALSGGGGGGGQSGRASVLHSPYLGRMCLEMILWIIMTPPGVPAGPASNVLDSFIILRFYVCIMYISQLSCRQVFKRAVATICGVRFDSSFVVRCNFLYESANPFILIGFIVVWLSLALLYAKAEVKGFAESAYFCFSTMTFVGYGDYAPRSLTGRIAAALSLALGLVVLAWCVAIVNTVTKLSTPETNMYTLFRTNKLCQSVPAEAARVIQRAWKLYAAKKEQRSALSIQFNAFWLTAQASSFRDLRRAFAASELAFLRATFSFEDAITAMTPASSRRQSPGNSPRLATSSASSSLHPAGVTFQSATPGGSSSNISAVGGGGGGGRPPPTPPRRRPFSLYQRVKPKEGGIMGTTPRSTPPLTPQPEVVEDDPLDERQFQRRQQQQQQQQLQLSAATAAAEDEERKREGDASPAVVGGTGLFIHTGRGRSSSGSGGGDDLQRHMATVEGQLDQLIRRAQKLSLTMLASSPTEVDS